MITYETLKSFCANEQDLRPAMTYACRREDGWWATDGRRIICVPMDECQQGDLRFLCDELPETLADKFPKVESVIDVKGFKSKFTISVESIKNAIAQLPLTKEYKEVEKEINYIGCPECDGGEIELTDTIYFNGEPYDISATTECPICHGYGLIPDFKDYDPEDDYNPEIDKTYIAKVRTGKMIPNLVNTLILLPNGSYIRSSSIADLLRVAREQRVEEIECNGREYPHCILFRAHGVIVGLMPMNNDDNKYAFAEIKTEI